jgi:C4-dicarboxylate-specific signal transduction histidine kinase
MAHELSQPLAAILSNAEAAELFLKMQPPQLDDVLEILVDIQRDDRRASDLIQQMRGHLKKSEVSLQLHDMNVLVADALKFLAAEAKVRAVTISSDTDGTALPVMVDRVQIQQVIINLILNSMDAMAAVGEGRRDIVVCCRRTESGQVEVSVTDSGTGFGPHVEQAFDSFFTTKPHGMGLGLSITAAIVKAHEGRIHAENAAQGGAIVRFSLPAGDQP